MTWEGPTCESTRPRFTIVVPGELWGAGTKQEEDLSRYESPLQNYEQKFAVVSKNLVSV